jgi:hypothetical protein
LLIDGRSRHAIKVNLGSFDSVEISALITGRRRVAEDFLPGRVADRGKGGDEPAGGIITLSKGLKMNLFVPAQSNASLQGFHIAVRNSIYQKDQSGRESERLRAC